MCMRNTAITMSCAYSELVHVCRTEYNALWRIGIYKYNNSCYEYVCMIIMLVNEQLNILLSDTLISLDMFKFLYHQFIRRHYY